MPTYRISYRIFGKRQDALWTCERDEVDMSSLARWLMSREFPGRLYRVDKGMQIVLRDHGITDIRSSIPIYWAARRPADW
jgi:hypothetical protein